MDADSTGILGNNTWRYECKGSNFKDWNPSSILNIICELYYKWSNLNEINFLSIIASKNHLHGNFTTEPQNNLDYKDNNVKARKVL